MSVTNETFPATFADLHVRTWFTQRSETLANETGRPADGAPVIKVVIACVLHNPFAGRFVEDLEPLIAASEPLGLEFGRRVQAAFGDVSIQSYGKAALVGVNGEYEHGNALLTTVFADPIRDAVGGGKSWVPSTGKRGGPGTEIDIPLGHKDALYVRANYDTITASFADAPGPDEILIAFGFASRGRLHARLGGLTHDEIVGEDGLR